MTNNSNIKNYIKRLAEEAEAMVDDKLGNDNKKKKKEDNVNPSGKTETGEVPNMIDTKPYKPELNRF